ncbi:MAG: hypothetical protein V3W19_03545 [Desulfatiglandales bacterium]
MKDIQLSLLVDMEDPQSVFEEVKTIILMMYSEFDFEALNRVFKDVLRLFNGEYPGYQKCNTEYHNLKHSTDAFLAMARLIHGAFLSGENLSRKDTNLGLVCALMHDTGYIQTLHDDYGTGAKYTRIDTNRSIAFMSKYLADNKFPEEDFKNYGHVLKGTSLDAKLSKIKFESPEIELLCKMMGTADLMGQMADRTYLEKLLFLFYEFRQGGIAGYDTELELLNKTSDFYAMAEARLIKELDDVKKYMPFHFKARWNHDRDLYMEAIEKHMAYLKFTMKNHEKEYRDYLRRGGIVKKLSEKGDEMT